MSAARQRLLDRVIDHVASQGLADLSLRELAAATETSHRMLNYHFGGREGLVAAIVTETEARQRQLLEELGARATTPAEVIRAQWATLTDPALAPFIRLFFELFSQAAAGRPGTDAFLEQMTEPWLDAADRVGLALGHEIDRSELRLGVAVMRGLLLDVVATGDPGPATASLESFLAMWEAHRAR